MHIQHIMVAGGFGPYTIAYGMFAPQPNAQASSINHG
jgi:hypothetical protein